MKIDEKKEKENKKTIMISTKISKELYEEIKKENVKINYLVSLGLINHKKNPLINKNIDDLRKSIDILKYQINRDRKKIHEIIQRITIIEKNK